MDGLIGRIAAVLLAIGAGMALGALVGEIVDWPRWWIVIGGLVLGLAALLRDLIEGARMMRWLREEQSTPAPRDRGFWGELGYRVERALRQRERAVEQERERLRQFLSAIEVSPNGVLLLDGNEQIEWCNSVAAQHFGLDPERDRGQRATSLLRAPAFVNYLQGQRYDEAMSYVDPRTGATLSVQVRPYGDGARLVLSQDITERERAEAMRRDFVANVSHEIRTPLTVLAGFVETLAQLPLTEVERARVFTLMTQQTERMQTLVADLLTLAQLEGSPRPPADRWIPVGRLLERALADASALSMGRHLLRLVGDEDIAEAEVAASEPELLSAVGNMLNNAVRYTPVGGHIELRWRWREEGGAAIEVADDGIGIARDHLPRLTERFYRVDSSRSRDTGGTGLGLAIVKHAVQRLGGEIDVESEPGKGSTFRVLLPALRVRRMAPRAAERVAA